MNIALRFHGGMQSLLSITDFLPLKSSSIQIDASLVRSKNPSAGTDYGNRTI